MIPDGNLIYWKTSDNNWTHIPCPACGEMQHGRLLGHLTERHGINHAFFAMPPDEMAKAGQHVQCMCGQWFFGIPAVYEHIREHGEQCIVVYLMNQ